MSLEKKKVISTFEIAYKDFAKGIFRFVYFKVSEYSLAEEITGDVFIRFWKVLSQGKSIENTKAFLYFIAKGFVVDYYRKKKHKKEISLAKIDEKLLGRFDNIEQKVSQQQEITYVFAKIKQLNKEYQDILFLHYVEDLTVKEIAYIQQKKENAVRVVLHRALQALKKNI